MSKSINSVKATEAIHIVFLHLDLGIGGAEQLIINLALASLRSVNPGPSDSDSDSDTSDHDNTSDSDENDVLNARVSILTTHCNQSHCFDAVRKDPKIPIYGGGGVKSVIFYCHFPDSCLREIRSTVFPQPLLLLMELLLQPLTLTLLREGGSISEYVCNPSIDIS